MVSMLALRRGAVVTSAIVCGAGVLTKAFPVVILVAAMIVLTNKAERFRYLVTFVATCACIVLPFALCGGADVLGSSYQFTASRDGWETVWLFPRVQFPPTPDPAQLLATFRSHERPYAWLMGLCGPCVLGYAAWQARAPRRLSLADHVLCLVLLLLVFAKGVSSYFVFWFFPLLFVCYPPLLAFVLCCGFLVVADLEFLEAMHWSSVWSRHLLFVALLLERLLSPRQASPA